MLDSRNLLGWLLVGMVGAVSAGAALLGVAMSPGTAGLSDALSNTIRAPSYSEVFTETTPVGSETGYLTYHRPDQLGGHIESGNRETYLYVHGPLEYQSVTVKKGTSAAHLTFYRQRAADSVARLDPAQYYMRLALSGRIVSQSGNTYTVTVTRGGATGAFTFTVTGQYIGQFTLMVQGTSVVVTISQVGTAPPVGLPKGARVVTAAPQGVPSGVAG